MIYNDIFSLDLKLFSKNKMKYIMDNKYSILIYIITIIIISWITIQFIIYIIYQFLRYYFFKNRSKNWLIEARRKYWIEILPPNINKKIPRGFIGNGKGYNSDFNSKEYNNIPLLTNHERDHEVHKGNKRMMRGWWPEFNWFSTPESNKYKVYSQLYNDVSRVLYNEEGEILSIICPQLGQCIKYLGCVRVEITVTHIKGWINEIDKTCKGEFQGHLKIWISEQDTGSELINIIKKTYKGYLPFIKDNAIIVDFYSNKELTNKSIQFVDSMDISPNLHPMAWFIVSFQSAYVGYPTNVNNPILDNIILNLVNINTANLFKTGNKLNWSIYLSAPELVDYNEYLEHVELMKNSYKLDQGNPLRPRVTPVITDFGKPHGVPQTFIDSIYNGLINNTELDYINKWIDY